MTDLEVTRRAVLLDPADRTARLVHADALEDAGQHEHAAFIRWQVGGCNGDPVGWSREWLPHPEMHGWEWRDSGLTGGNLRCYLSEQLEAIYELGFIPELAAKSWQVFEKYAPSLFSAHPVQRAYLRDLAPLEGRIEYGPGKGTRTWLWLASSYAGGQSLRHFLPAELHEWPGWRRTPMDDGMIRHYTRQAATDFLSNALVWYGRVQAGLPV